MFVCLIINHMEEGDIGKAYDTLIRAYLLEENSFDISLIGYMRTILYINIAELEKQAKKQQKSIDY